MDEEATIRTLTAYREVMTSLIQQHRGRVVDSPGDNLLAEPPNPPLSDCASIHVFEQAPTSGAKAEGAANRHDWSQDSGQPPTRHLHATGGRQSVRLLVSPRMTSHSVRLLPASRSDYRLRCR